MADYPPHPSPGPSGPTRPAGMVGRGAALGAWIWWVERLFEVTGAWVPSAPEAAVRIHLAELSRVLGEHAGALRHHLPRPASIDPDRWVAAPSAEAVEGLAELAAAERSIERLAGLHRVLVPRLLVAWRTEARRPAVADRSLARTLGHAHLDLVDLWHDGQGLLQLAVDLGGAAAVRTAADAAGATEAAVVAGGGLLAPGPPSGPS